MNKAREIEILESLGSAGKNIWETSEARYLVHHKEFVDITLNTDEKPNTPYFHAKLNHRGETYLAMLRRDNADNRSSLTSRRI